MKYNPHDYQKYTTDFIISHPISAIILQMGLGKTAATLDAVNQLIYDSFEVSKVLIVAPKRVAEVTWSNEIKKWDQFNCLTYSIVLGDVKQRRKALVTKANIYIINRDNLSWLIEKSGLPFDYDMVVLDELSSFKNYKSIRSKAFMKVRSKPKRIVGLTGTPSPNGMMDLFGEFKVLDGGVRLGRFIGQYRDAYFNPGKRNREVVYTYNLKRGGEEAIYKKISDITVSMKALDHLKMPELLNNEYKVYMDDKQSKYYATLKKEYLLEAFEGKDITAVNAASLSNKLCQMANGAIYTNDKEVINIHDKKLDALEDILEANESPILLCYWFKHDLTRIEKKLKELKVKYAKIDSEESINNWNKGLYKVGLVHPASAGHGLNLQEGGNTIVWFGLTWSLELYQQTNARLYRQGQRSDTVIIIHIVTTGTIDEDILAALKNKDVTQNRLIEAVKANLKTKLDNKRQSKGF